MTKNYSSGKTGERIGSAVVPNDVRIEGVMIKKVMKTMIRSMNIIEPPGGGGGGGAGPLLMGVAHHRKGMKVSLHDG